MDDIEMFRSLVEEASHSPEHSEEWTKALQQGCPDAWIAVLIPSLQNVTSLRLRYHCSPTYSMPMVARAAVGEKPFDLNPVFQKLEDVMIIMQDDNKASYRMDDLLPFFSFPLKPLSVASSTKSHPDSFPFLERKPDGWPQSALGRLTASAKPQLPTIRDQRAQSATPRTSIPSAPFPTTLGESSATPFRLPICGNTTKSVCWHKDCASAIRCCAEGRGLWTRAAVLDSGQHQSISQPHAAENVDD